ncbi:Putative ATP synthase subunit K [Septoria linicola]|uniref:ATP synthase subunit K n=1 Tax=Septoria linicola TaxID=215465 RepID=A0A9Q9EKV9_9PEZI|nr:putative ATP synthase subunit K [Septoria linicola]USW54465.1 Putative ATP synthase subunit K [Septoria linicola]
MVVYYELFGQKVGSHVLSIATLSTLFVGTWAMSGGKKTSPANQGPPINASSKDEENFIQEFLKQAESEEKKGAKH